MKFVNSLQVLLNDIEKNDNFYEKMTLLEEQLAKFEWLWFEILDDEIILFKEKYFDKENISFADYLEEWKFLKNFFIENDFFTQNNYKSFFKMKKIVNSGEPEDLEKYIAKVPENDQKLLQTEDFLKKFSK